MEQDTITTLATSPAMKTLQRVLIRNFGRLLDKEYGTYTPPGNQPRFHLNTRRREIFRSRKKGMLTCRLTKTEWNIIQSILQKRPANSSTLRELAHCKNNDALYAAVCRINKKVRKSLDVYTNLIEGCTLNPQFNIANPFGDE